MGHSVASLYKNTSICCPFTKGSFGRCISRGVISAAEGVLEEVVSEANVLDRGRNGDEDGGEEAIGEVGEEPENAGCKGESVAEVSDAAD